MATPACSMAASRRAASGAPCRSSGAVEAAGVANTTSSAGSPSTRHPAPSAASLGHRGAALDRDPSCSSLAGDGVDQRGHPLGRREEDRAGDSGSGGAGPTGREEQAAAAAQRGQLRHAGEAEAVGVGGVDAADQGIDQAVLHLVAEPGCGSVDRCCRRRPSAAAAGARAAARSLPLIESRPLEARRRTSPGTPRARPSGIGWSPLNQTAGLASVGDVSSLARPTSSASCLASGTRARNESAPSSTAGRPANGESCAACRRADRRPPERRSRRRPGRSGRPGTGRSTAR